MSTAVSPLAPKKYAKMPPLEGVRIATAEAGIKYKNRTDLLLMVFDEGTRSPGVFTRSKCPSAPVDFCRPTCRAARRGRWWSIPAMPTPSPARRAARRPRMTGEAAAKAAGCKPARCSSPRPASSASRSTPAEFSPSAGRHGEGGRPGRWGDAGKAIMTTDTYPKYRDRTVKLGDVDVTINGIAKGAGMIAPDMATMLSFVATDAPIAAPVLQALLSKRRRQDLQRRHRRQRHVDQRHAAAVRHRGGGKRGAPRITDPKDPRAGGLRRR
jgi:glutamate N-acetyltransferase/amino-acid N-acetyltransferase